MKRFLIIIFLGVWCTCLFAADLVVSGQTNKIFQNQTYGHLSITNSSSNITVKNCKFTTSYAANGSGGVGDISGSSYITIDSCDFNGDTTTCTGMNISGSYITISNCIIHDIADDGFQCYHGDHIYFYHNTVCHLYGCGSDGGCGPCYNGHSDAFELGFLDTVVLDGNLVYDVRSTSAIMDNDAGTSPNIHDILLQNNIFYTPECGVVVYVFYVDGVKMYNNTIWKSNWLGVAVGPSVTRVEAYNNIVQCIDYNFLGGTYNANDHKYDYNLVGVANRGLAAQAHDIVNPDPKFRRIPISSDNTPAHLYRTVTPADFELMAGSPAISAGTSANGVPPTDFYGRGRTVPYDMGAIKYVNTGVRQTNYSMRSSGKDFRFPSVVYSKNAPALCALGRAAVYDLSGRKTEGTKAGNGCFFVKQPDGGVQRIVVVP
jgi:hypothetical protein